jgi:hypothetical protein
MTEAKGKINHFELKFQNNNGRYERKQYNYASL